MGLRKHLNFANVAAGTALAIALAGGGVAVGAGLAKNSVGSPQVKPNSLKSSDIKDASLKGVKSARTVDTVKKVRSIAVLGQVKVVYTKGPFVVEHRCTDEGANNYRSAITLRTTVDNAYMDANEIGDEYSDFDVASGPADLVYESNNTEVDGEEGGFSALSADGKTSLMGQAFAITRWQSPTTCYAEINFIG